jgi:hypothetical protein
MKKKLISLKIDETDHEEWKRKAEEANRGLSDWIRMKCNADENDKADVPRVPDRSVLEGSTVGDGGFFGKPAYQEHSRSCQCGVCNFAREAGVK